MPKETLATVAVRNAGPVTGARGLVFLVVWGLASDSLGHPASMAEYIEWSGARHTTAYREALRFKAAFPGEDGPERLWSEVRRAVRSRDRAGAIAEAFSAPWVAG